MKYLKSEVLYILILKNFLEIVVMSVYIFRAVNERRSIEHECLHSPLEDLTASTHRVPSLTIDLKVMKDVFPFLIS